MILIAEDKSNSSKFMLCEGTAFSHQYCQHFTVLHSPDRDHCLYRKQINLCFPEAIMGIFTLNDRHGQALVYMEKSTHG